MKMIGLNKKGESPFESINALGPFYNLTQVIICSYMMLRAAEVYYRQGYKLICNEFNVKDKEMTFVLYLFYLSKVCNGCILV